MAADPAPAGPPRVAVVTGGTRGIGLGIARALAAEHWSLALCGLRPRDEVAGVLDELAGPGRVVEYWPADVGRRADRERLVGELTARFPAVHALVNNAGRAPRVRADLLDASEASFEELIATNLQGPYFLTQALARHFLSSAGTGTERRAVVFVTSVSAELASTNRGEYCVSKAGLAMAVQLFALRLAPAGVSVFEVRPGVIATDMTAGVKEMYDRRIAEGLVPEGRWGQPGDVGRVVAALLRGDLPYSTGSVIHVDGGLTLGRL
ncbi:MAG TPA: 3-ketoacyl-ACP reductase [Vicinamibacterales bacterium]|nr:3-ketoacyl-ACP reductase [Vicinamibacterales bacterium]